MSPPLLKRGCPATSTGTGSIVAPSGNHRGGKENDGYSQPYFYPKAWHGHLLLEAPGDSGVTNVVITYPSWLIKISL